MGRNSFLFRTLLPLTVGLKQALIWPLVNSSSAPRQPRLCSRQGCGAPVKKPTAKYCSVQCSAHDPERRARLRERARSGQVLPLARQLPLDFFGEEQRIAHLAGGREEIPLGLSRWAV